MLIALAALAMASEGTVQTYTVGGLSRKALIYRGKAAHPPLVLVFHGHGGTMNQASLSFNVQNLWSEATVIYPEGLPTKGRTDPEGTRNGWQVRPGTLDDRDLKFVDAILGSIKDRDPKRTFAMGHSNGGAMTYVVWAARRKEFAAFGPSGSPVIQVLKDITPAPMFATAGEKDELVSYPNQVKSIEAIAKLDGVDMSAGRKTALVTLYKGSKFDMGTYIHPGGHRYPAEAAKATVEFFKRQLKD